MTQKSKAPLPRHPATVKVWEWLESGDGQGHTEVLKETIRKRIEEIDAAFLSWDRKREAGPEYEGGR